MIEYRRWEKLRHYPCDVQAPAAVETIQQRGGTLISGHAYSIPISAEMRGRERSTADSLRHRFDGGVDQHFNNGVMSSSTPHHVVAALVLEFRAARYRSETRDRREGRCVGWRGEHDDRQISLAPGKNKARTMGQPCMFVLTRHAS